MVAVAAFPEMLMPHVPEAPVPVRDGISVPIASPRFVLALEAVVAPVPPLATATVPVTFAALPEMSPVIFEPAKDVIHAGLA